MAEPSVPLSSGDGLLMPGHADDAMTNLPAGYGYTMKSCTANKVVFTVNAGSQDELMEWLAQYSDLTKTTWRVRRNSHPCCATVLFRAERRCQHMTRSHSLRVSTKNTDCPAWMKLTVRAADKRKKQPAYSIVQLNNQHNHATMSRYALSKRDVSEDARTKLLSLFADGYGPTAAVKVLRSEFRLTSSDAQSAVLGADRAIIPTISYATALYRKTIPRPYGPHNDPAKRRNRQAKRTRPNIKRTAPKVNHGVGNEVVEGVSPVVTNDDSLSASDGETPMDETDNYNTNNCQLIVVTTEDWADEMPLGEQCEVSSSAAWIQNLLDDVTPPETEQMVIVETEKTVELEQTPETGQMVQQTCNERLAENVKQIISQTDTERMAHDAKQTIPQTGNERLAENVRQTIQQTDEERLSQAVTVAMRSLSISINAMVNSCTPSVDLVTAIWKCKSRVDSERTNSGVIKLLQSLDHRLPATVDATPVQPTSTVQPKIIAQPTAIEPTAVQPTSTIQPRATVQPTSTVQLRAIQPKATVQPKATAQPMTIVQPMIFIQPIPIIQPRPTVQTRVTVQPTATIQPTATVQPTIIIQPIPIIQPTATVQTRATVKRQPPPVQPTAITQVNRASKRVASWSPVILNRVA